MTLLPVDEAQARLFALAPPVEAETAPLAAALGRWAAEPVRALRTQPWADLSAMDGYALRFDDLPGPLGLVGESAAGRPFEGVVGPGETARISTGAVLPKGADTVLLQEEAARDGDTVRLDGAGPPFKGAHVRKAGSDFACDDIILEPGERITAQHIGLAALAGLGKLPVRRRPRVALVSTGDELAPPGAPLVEGRLPASNGPMLAALLGDVPADIVDLGILPDSLDALTNAFRAVDADILVTTGGASVGDHDLVRPALLAAGAELDFWRVAMKPGKPLMAGRLGRTVTLGLPGNPVSAFVTGTLFLKPLVAALSGARAPVPVPLPGLLGSAMPATGKRRDYLRARLVGGRPTLLRSQDSAAMRALASADALIVREAESPAADPGDPCLWLPLS